MTPPHPPLMSGLRRRWLVIGTAAAPWSWFLVRDTVPVLEWAAILLPLLVAGSLGVLLLFGRWTSRLLGQRGLVGVVGMWTIFGIVVVVGPWVPDPTPEPTSPMTILTANVLADNNQSAQAAQDILRAGADVVVLQEVLPGRQDLVVSTLDAAYPHRHLDGQDGVGVWSRYPLRAESPRPALPTGARGSRVIVSRPTGPVVLYALHLYRPSRDAYQTEVTVQGQRVLVNRLDDLFDAEEQDVVVAGDLNLTDRGGGYRRLVRGRRDAQGAGWASPTGLRDRNRPLLLRIDHLIIPEQWCSSNSRRLRIAGSDHRAVIATVGPCS